MEGFDSWDSFLCHHGIKGQKWGVRNYQNADGTLTAAGKERYGTGNGYKTGEKGGSVKERRKQYKKEAKAAKRAAANARLKQVAKKSFSKIKEAYKKRHPEKMTDDELKKRLNRLVLEKQYRDLAGLTEKAESRRRLRNIGFNAAEASIRVGETAVKTAADVVSSKLKSMYSIAKDVSSRYSSEGAKNRAELTTAKNAARKQRGKDKGSQVAYERQKEERKAREAAEESKRKYERERAEFDLRRERERRKWEREKHRLGIS